MKLKIINIISGILFLISSLTLLTIPFVDTDNDSSFCIYISAMLFWLGLICGIILQIILAISCRNYRKKGLSKLCRILGCVFAASIILIIPVLVFLNDNLFILPIDLFFIFLSAEMFFVIKRKEYLQ